MHYVNTGEITGFKEEELDAVINLIVHTGIYDRKENVPVYEKPYLSIGIEDVYGDISCRLQQFTDSCVKRDIRLNGIISYYGDSEGTYEIKNGEVKEFDKDELAIREASDQVLLAELQRRGYLKVQIELEAFFSTVGETEKIIVCDEDGKEIARYDGKQSIPLELNHRRVIKVTRISDNISDDVTVVVASEEN